MSAAKFVTITTDD